MSRRVRHTPGTAEEAQPAGSRAGSADSVAPSWNACFHGFSAEDRARILELALPTGVVYAHQLPHPKSARKNDDPQRSILTPFLNGHVEQLEPSEHKPITCFDDELDRWQKEAVAKSLATPDLFLLRGHPGSGKSRVLVEVIRQAIGRGQRVLFVSRNPAVLDRVLTALSAAGDALAVRFIHPGENEHLRPEVRATLLESRVADLAARARSAGKLDHAAHLQECEQFDRAQASWPALVDLLAQRVQLDERRRELESKRASLPQELAALVESVDPTAAGGEFAHTWYRWTDAASRKKAANEASIVDLERGMEGTKARLNEHQLENDRLAPLVTAKAGGRFWTAAWWSATLRPAETQRGADVARLLATAALELEQQEKSLALAVAERQRLADETTLERTQLLDQERIRRENALSAELGELDIRGAELTRRWQSHCAQLPAPSGSAIACLEDLERARQHWVDGSARARDEALRAEQWLALLDRHPHALRDAIVENAPLIAATAAGWTADRGLAGRLSSKPFDFLILEEAEQFVEAECAGFASLARRWLFIGSDYLLDDDLAASPSGAAEKAETLQIRHPVFFGQLWQRLHSNPKRLPYSWVQEEDKLICRLRPIFADQRTWIETERLADHPQIVLHILALPRSQPVVAEVVFPAAFTIQKAKQFILQELQELAVHAPVRSMRWHDEHAERLVLQFAGRVCHHPAAVALAPGIMEMLNPRDTAESGGPAGLAWQTCCIEFDRQSGWQRGTAEEWIERHLGLRDLGRTLYLDGHHRFSESMSVFVKTLISTQLKVTSLSPTNVPPCQAVECIAVPPLAENGRTERGGPGARIRAAGLELDMNEPKNRERLPADLRAGLPAQGFVNLSEAQAIIRRLVDCERLGSLPSTPTSEPSIYIIALYDAQAELIRRLLRSAPSLAAHTHSIEVGRPQAFVHRDAPWVFISLTRSHSHRSTAFGAGPGELLLALTRARDKMFVHGDVGALARRAQWEGTVEHLDLLQSNQERDLVKTLLASFHTMPHPRSASVGSEGSRT